MKYYSEILDKLYDSVEELEKAEQDEKKKDSEKNDLAKEIERLLALRDEVINEYRKKKQSFINNYGSISICKDENGYVVDTDTKKIEVPFVIRDFKW